MQHVFFSRSRQSVGYKLQRGELGTTTARKTAIRTCKTTGNHSRDSASSDRLARGRRARSAHDTATYGPFQPTDDRGAEIATAGYDQQFLVGQLTEVTGNSESGIGRLPEGNYCLLHIKSPRTFKELKEKFTKKYGYGSRYNCRHRPRGHNVDFFYYETNTKIENKKETKLDRNNRDLTHHAPENELTRKSPLKTFCVLARKPNSNYWSDFRNSRLF
ncbi:hypothetical protein [Paraburkholderia sp. BL6669N2]|uniref:hypothetical protein n=1 Tax=Paraburkholderia sp. BL6669N2 TaxID=1938807 RepID=UPI0015F2A06A|nr:hypothetical protein [Paraburkholderia sp. BL6669N2]